MIYAGLIDICRLRAVYLEPSLGLCRPRRYIQASKIYRPLRNTANNELQLRIRRAVLLTERMEELLEDQVILNELFGTCQAMS